MDRLRRDGTRLRWAVAAAMIAAACTPRMTFAEPSTSRCVVRLNSAGVAVFKAKLGLARECLMDAIKNPGSTDADVCFAADPKGSVSKALAKLQKAGEKECTTSPPFGPSSAMEVAAAAQQSATQLVSDVFGLSLGAIADAAADTPQLKTCVGFVAKQVVELGAAKARSFNTCKNYGLKAGTIIDVGGMEICVASIGDDQKVSALASRLTANLGDNCTDRDKELGFLGECANATWGGSLAECIDQRIECQTCVFLNTMDNMAFDCDAFDDGIVMVPPSCP